MPLNFPDSPNNGDTYQGYTYNSTVGAWAPAAADTGGVTVYATVDDLPATGTAGDQAFVTASNRLYLWNGSGWYNIALINTTPTISGVSSSYVLASDGTATTVTITATDPEGLPITYSIASDTSGNVATVTQNANVFTITPSTNTADAGTFSLTFRVSDGVNIATAVSSFTLQFKVVNSNYTTALITSVGDNNAVNNSFVDSSTNSHTITSYGNVTQTTFSPYRHGGYSTYFDGSGDYLQLSASNDWGFGTGAWTVEFWINTTDTDADVVAAFNAGSPYTGWSVRIASGLVQLFVSDGSSNEGFSTVSGTTIVNDSVWHHVVVTSAASSNTVSCYVDGVLAGSNAFSIAISSTGQILRVGADTNSSPSRPLAGYLTDVRIVKGSQVYTSAFTPPTERLTAITNTSLLTCHLPYFADGSTNDHTITVNGNTKTEPFAPYDYETYSASENLGSIYFDGSGDYLRADTALDASTSAGDPMTVETWFNVPSSATLGSSSSFNAIWGFNAASNGSNVATFGVTDTGFYWHRNTAGITLSNSWGRDQWHHLAVVYHDGTNGTAVYLNGESIYTDATAHTTAFADCVCGIGAEFDAGSGGTPGNYFPGHLSDFRITHSAVYTSNFTPPASPLTEITNTALLLRGTNAGIIDKSQTVKALTLNGDVKSSTAQTKYLSSSMYFDEASDYIYIPNIELGTDDFTIEGWHYLLTRANTRNGIWGNYTTYGSGALGMFAGHSSGTTTSYQVAYNGTSFPAGGLEGGTIAYNQWVHFALVRNSGTMTLYIDGSSVDSMTATASLNGSGSNFVIGAPGDNLSSGMHGYLEDFRVTKGLARYTANFTPPTAALEG